MRLKEAFRNVLNFGHVAKTSILRQGSFMILTDIMILCTADYSACVFFSVTCTDWQFVVRTWPGDSSIFSDTTTSRKNLGLMANLCCSLLVF